MMSREDFLKRIQKEAKENGGRPLSSKKFEEKTGIKPYYWQKYWSRFGDVQREAGLTPNTFLKTPYDREYLCKKFIKLMRELKKWPTKGDMEVKHNSDPKFPGSSIFYRNLGIKRDLALKILEYAENKRYKDVTKICDSVIKDPQNQDKLSTDGKERHGFVYLTKSGPHYKIGHTNNMERRISEIGSKLPLSLEVIHEIKTDDPDGVEIYWHARFKLKQVRGEWFRLDGSDVRAFKRWKRII